MEANILKGYKVVFLLIAEISWAFRKRPRQLVEKVWELDITLSYLGWRKVIEMDQ